MIIAWGGWLDNEFEIGKLIFVRTTHGNSVNYYRKLVWNWVWNWFGTGLELVWNWFGTGTEGVTRWATDHLDD